jgi:hypothetical protein
MDLDQLAKKRQAPVLTRENWRTWFELLELYFIGESLDFVLQETEAQYTWIPRTSTALTPQSTSTSGTVEDITTGIQNLFKVKSAEDSAGCWNIERRAAYKAARAKVLYHITICIEETDKEFIKDFNEINQKWDKLRAKYEQSKPHATREDVRQITHFKLKPDTTIDDVWTKLKEFRRRLVVGNPQLASGIKDKDLFEFLLDGLPEEYSITRSVLDAQVNLDVHEKLLVLQQQQD